ncbi:MAG: cyclopropane fatty-acyl-phospholipid synthase-like methyltransferase [Gammaproteobacteria bacterium]|jgi:cyclopropane fatty-acyl-phospholipid synthase-like methyltransferase
MMNDKHREESNDPEVWAEYHTKRLGTPTHALNVLKRSIVCEMFANKILRMSGPVSSVLELGCGTGSVLNVISRRMDANAVGVDRDQGCISTAQHNYPRATYQQGDIFNLPFEEKSFDLVYSVGLFEHFSYEDQLRLLNIHARYAKRYVALMVPADSWVMNSILYFNKRILKRNGTWADEEVFSKRLLQEKFSEYEFNVQKDHRFANMILWFGWQP